MRLELLIKSIHPIVELAFDSCLELLQLGVLFIDEVGEELACVFGIIHALSTRHGFHGTTFPVPKSRILGAKLDKICL